MAPFSRMTWHDVVPRDAEHLEVVKPVRADLEMHPDVGGTRQEQFALETERLKEIDGD